MIKVVMAEDQLILRDSLKFIIEQDRELEVVGCAGNGREALELCDRFLPDVVLMDLRMPDCDGVEGTRMIKEKHRSIRVLILTTFDGNQDIARALENGADGYILKDITPEDLILVIKNAAKGFGIIHKTAYKTILEQFSGKNEVDSPVDSDEGGRPEEDGAGSQLTEREMSIIRLIVEGKNNREIAASLYLTEGRIKNVITGILTKLKLKDRVQLVVYAFKNNLV